MKILVVGFAFVLSLVAQIWVAEDPVIHVLVQFPLLVFVGYCLASGMRIQQIFMGPLLVLAVAAILFWMLPRTLDAILTEWGMFIAKFVLLPLTVGVPLALCWRHLNPVVRGFVKAQAISMLGILGFLYTHAPVRICNSYLLDDQVRLGYGFFLVVVGLSIVWTIPVFIGDRHEMEKNTPSRSVEIS
ncbi:MAG: hypothetical protein MI743_02830 [Sneathiellales bacterium]|nr:hypothetical protein [Sneathiellales bacterium]